MEKQKKFDVHIERDIKLTTEDIDDIMVAALEGGINYYDSLEEKVREILNDISVEYEVIYPDRYITVC